MSPSLGFPAAWQIAGRDLVPFEDIPENFATRRPGAEASPGANALGIDLRHHTSPTTPVTDTFIVSHYGVPTTDAATWKLTVDGSAQRPITLSLAELKRRPRVEKTVMFECGGNRDGVLHRMVSAVTWAGCSLRPLLEEARPERDVLEAQAQLADAQATLTRADQDVARLAPLAKEKP